MINLSVFLFIVVLVYRAFILPYLDSAYSVAWKDLGQIALLYDARYAFREVGDSANEKTTLRTIIVIATDWRELNNADQARVQLAELMVKQQRFDEAIGQLNEIVSEDMSGAKGWIPKIEKQRETHKKQEGQNQN